MSYEGTAFAVIAKKAMWRGGRQWTAGVHEFTSREHVASIGDDDAVGKMLATLLLYPDDFDVRMSEVPLKEPEAAAAS
jgi:hypothetical protein